MDAERNYIFKRSHLVTSLLVTLVIILAISFASFYTSFNKVYFEQKKVELKLLADNLASDHEGSIHGIRQFLITSGYLVEEVENGQENCSALLQKMYVIYPYFLNIGITNEEGEVTCSGVEIRKTLNLNEDSDFIEAKETNNFTVSGYRISTLTGRPSVRFLQPIMKGSDFNGVLFVTFATEWLNGFSPSFDPPQGTVITKFDQNGMIFMRYPNPLTWSGTDQVDSELFKQIQAQKIGFAEIGGLEGKRRLYYFRPIYHNGEIHAYLAVGTNKTQ
jgi:hypothetical protein